MVAALFVETDGVYYGLSDVDPWDVTRDARLYAGPHPVVAHPPCERWGRYAESHPIKGKIANVGDDGGKFFHALWCIRTFGGVLEHPKDSLAWEWFGLMKPSRDGWQRADNLGGWTCQVEQGHYGHFSRKATWLYAAHVDMPSLVWGPAPQRIHPVALAKHGYAKARRIGMTAMVGGKDKKKIRERTPIAFRDELLAIAGSANEKRAA